MALVDSLIVFVVSLLIGALGIYVGASVLTSSDDYGYAVVTALIASLIWVLFSWVPLLGPLLALVAYLGVINWRYPGGWLKAAGIALLAWVASSVVLYLLAVLGVVTFGAIGVPGT